MITLCFIIRTHTHTHRVTLTFKLLYVLNNTIRSGQVEDIVLLISVNIQMMSSEFPAQ